MRAHRYLPLLLVLGVAPACVRAGFAPARGDAAGDHGAHDGDGAGPDGGPDSGPDSGPDGPPPGPGTHLWSARLGPAGGVLTMLLATDASSNIFAAGTFAGAVDLGGGALTSAGEDDVYLASFTAAGGHRWSRALGGSGADAALALAVDPAGRVVVTGTFEGSAELGGGELAGAGNEDIFVASYDAADGAHRWSHAFGGDGDDGGRGVAVDASSNVFVTGYFAGSASLGGAIFTSAGSNDVFVASYDDSGAHRWSRACGGSDNDIGYSVAVSPTGGPVVAGYFYGTADLGGGLLTSAGNYDVFLARYDDSGAHVWSRAQGGSGSDFVRAVAVSSESGHVFLTGSFQQTADFGGSSALTSAGSQDVFLASYDAATGAHRWSQRFGGVETDAGNGLAVGPGGDLFVAGTFGGTATFGGSLLTSTGGQDLFVASFTDAGAHRWSQRYGAKDEEIAVGVAVDPDGHVSVAARYEGAISVGGNELPSVGASDVLLLSTTDTGAHRWTKAFAGPGFDVAGELDVAPGGDVVVSGRFAGTLDLGTSLPAAGATDIFCAAYAAGGALRWAKAFGSPEFDEARAVAVNAAGDVFLAGAFQGTIDFGGGPLTSAGGQETYVASFTSEGDHRWSLRAGSSGYDGANDVAVGPDGGIFVTGIFQNTIDLGGGALTAVGNYDIFLASFAADGVHRWSMAFGGGGSDIGLALALLPGGDLVLVGSFQESIDFGGGSLTAAGGLADAFVAGFTEDGVHRWSMAFGDDNHDAAHDVAVDASGNVYVTGRFDGTVDLGGGPLTSAGTDVFLAAFTADGLHRWSRRFGDSAYESSTAVAVNPAGQLFVTGTFEQTIDFGGGPLTSAGQVDIFLASITAEGEHRWSRRFGDSRDDHGVALAATAAAVMLSGDFDDRIDFGGGPIVGAGAGFIAVFVP